MRCKKEEFGKKSNSHIYTLYAGMALTGITFLISGFFDTNLIFPSLRFIGYLCWLFGVIFWILGMLSLKKHSSNNNYMNTNNVVTDGIYKYLNHPQYMGFIFFNIGIFFKTQNLYFGIANLLNIVFLILGSINERKALLEKFKEEN